MMARDITATVCFPLCEGEVLLGLKKRGFGAGWWNGFGGKIQKGETLRESVCRELSEESGLIAKESDFKEVAQMHFYLPDAVHITVHTYFLSLWEGEPIETEEMQPRWFPMEELPYAQMWPGDALWIPEILKGRIIEGEIRFGSSTGEVASCQIADAVWG